MPTELLRAFIRENLASVWELELLLLIHRERARSWRAVELNREIRGSLGLVTQILEKLVRAGLVAQDGDETFRFAPRSPELEELVTELAEAYGARPFAIVREILAAPNEKIQFLADAFKVKKD